MARRALLIIALGVLGVAAAATVAYAATRLTSEPIGLADAPLSAGDDLAPAAVAGQGPPRIVTAPAPAQTGQGSPPGASGAPSLSDDHDHDEDDDHDDHDDD